MSYSQFARKNQFTQVNRGVFDAPRPVNAMGMICTSAMVLLAISSFVLSVF